MDSSWEGLLPWDDQFVRSYGSGLGEFGRAGYGGYTHWIWRVSVITYIFGGGGEQAISLSQFKYMVWNVFVRALKTAYDAS